MMIGTGNARLEYIGGAGLVVTSSRRPDVRFRDRNRHNSKNARQTAVVRGE